MSFESERLLKGVLLFDGENAELKLDHLELTSELFIPEVERLAVADRFGDWLGVVWLGKVTGEYNGRVDAHWVAGDGDERCERVGSVTLVSDSITPLFISIRLDDHKPVNSQADTA